MVGRLVWTCQAPACTGTTGQLLTHWQPTMPWLHSIWTIHPGNYIIIALYFALSVIIAKILILFFFLFYEANYDIFVFFSVAAMHNPYANPGVPPTSSVQNHVMGGPSTGQGVPDSVHNKRDKDAIYGWVLYYFFWWIPTGNFLK